MRRTVNTTVDHNSFYKGFITLSGFYGTEPVESSCPHCSRVDPNETQYQTTLVNALFYDDKFMKKVCIKLNNSLTKSLDMRIMMFTRILHEWGIYSNVKQLRGSSSGL